MKVEELSVGERFRFNWNPEKVATVLHVGDSGVMVKMDKSGRTVRIVKKAKWGSGKEDTVCEFEAPGRPTLISGATEVTRIKGEEDAA